jgi:hypothetical protein
MHADTPMTLQPQYPSDLQQMELMPRSEQFVGHPLGSALTHRWRQYPETQSPTAQSEFATQPFP